MKENRTRKEQFQRLEAAFDAGHAGLTIVLARCYLRDYPRDVPAWYFYGHILTEMARYTEAERALKNALKYCPTVSLPAVFNEMGCHYQARAEYRKAAVYFRKAIKATPTDATGFILLGAMFAKQGLLKKAEKEHRKATNCVEGCLDEAFLNLGLVLRGQERFVEAADCFRKALDLNPKYRIAKIALADVQQTMKNLGRKRDGVGKDEVE